MGRFERDDDLEIDLANRQFILMIEDLFEELSVRRFDVGSPLVLLQLSF